MTRPTTEPWGKTLSDADEAMHPAGGSAGRRGPRSGQLVAAAAGFAQLLSGFLAWTATGAAGLDVEGPTGARIGATMIVLAAVALVPMLVGDRGWPRLASGTASAALVLAHLQTGPDGAVTAGVALATGAAIGQWLAAALATGGIDEVARLSLGRHADPSGPARA